MRRNAMRFAILDCARRLLCAIYTSRIKARGRRSSRDRHSVKPIPHSFAQRDIKFTRSHLDALYSPQPKRSTYAYAVRDVKSASLCVAHYNKS